MKKTLRVLIVLLSSCICSCANTEENNQNPPLVEDKYRLMEDREKIEELRKDIPVEKRKENDEIAFNLQWMNEIRLNPSDIRSKFSQHLSRKRNLFNKDMTTARTEFSKEEKRKRDEFNQMMNQERATIARRHKNSKSKKELLDELDYKRKDFSAKQKLERDTFEEEVRDKKKAFEDYWKQRSDSFNADLKAYTLEFNEKKKVEKQIEKNRRSSEATNSGS